MAKGGLFGALGEHLGMTDAAIRPIPKDAKPTKQSEPSLLGQVFGEVVRPAVTEGVKSEVQRFIDDVFNTSLIPPVVAPKAREVAPAKQVAAPKPEAPRQALLGDGSAPKVQEPPKSQPEQSTGSRVGNTVRVILGFGLRTGAEAAKVGGKAVVDVAKATRNSYLERQAKKQAANREKVTVIDLNPGEYK